MIVEKSIIFNRTTWKALPLYRSSNGTSSAAVFPSPLEMMPSERKLVTL